MSSQTWSATSLDRDKREYGVTLSARGSFFFFFFLRVRLRHPATSETPSLMTNPFARLPAIIDFNGTAGNTSKQSSRVFARASASAFPFQSRR